MNEKHVFFTLNFKSNERSEYSYICLGEFFCFGFFIKKLIFCSRSVLILRGLTCDFFSSLVHFPSLKEGKLHYRTAKA